ncbi:MAG TPA: hypothetical protein VIL74_22605 [Pyrinomonadaceae bacterium]|jgi:hypothetical protein
MTENRAAPPILQAPLNAILGSELAAGNEIAEIQLGGWSEVDIVVTLKFPFRKDHREDFTDAAFYRNADAHYPLTDSYTANREAVEAPY